MTKKIFLGMSAMAMLFATSCKDDFAESFVGDQTTVEFSISTPEIGTRYGEGTKATHLQYAVYDATGTELDALTETEGEIYGPTKVTLDLTTGDTYTVVFWAAAPNAPYTVDFGTKTMKVNYNGALSNDENRDAFYAVETFTVNGAESKTIELKRPFAQLNIGTNDYTLATNAGYTPTQSSVTVSKIYSTLTFFDNNDKNKVGIVSGETDVTFAMADINKDETFPVANYQYLAMNYLLVPADKGLVNVEFGYKEENGKAKTRTICNVPVQRNYRTNIYGKLLTSEVDINVEIEPDFNDHQYNISTADELQEAIYDAVAEGSGTITLTDDIIANEIITIGTNTRSNAGTPNARIVINGNGKTLTSTAGRAINVSGVNGVTIQNLTIDAKGERAINIIQNATNVTIKDVTATAANYTVNVATSAPNAVVAIKNSELTGLNVVNVASPGANVTVDGSTINCNDNNDTAGESYAALCLNKAAVGGKIIATNTDVNVPEGSDSEKGRNGAEDGVVTINGSTEGVTVTVAAITYPGSDYYYGFQTLQAAIEFAKDGETITLIRDITTSEPYIIEGKNITLDLNGKTVTASSSSAFVAKEDAELTIKNGKVVAYESTVSAQGGKIIVESGEYTSTGTAVDTPATRRYSLDCREGGELVVNGGTFKSNNGMINVGSTVTINGGKFENVVEKNTTRHFAYVSAQLTINDGEFYGKANSGAGGCFFCGAASTGKVTVNGGKFTSLWTSGYKNNIWESYFGGSIEIKGGIFNHNGGIKNQVTENTDAATMDAYPYKAK